LAGIRSHWVGLFKPRTSMLGERAGHSARAVIATGMSPAYSGIVALEERTP